MTRGDKGKLFIVLFLYLLSLSQQDCVLPVIYLDKTNYNVNTRQKINAEQNNSQQIL